MNRPINFQSLPSKSPNALPKPGIYACTIKAAAMMRPENPYLQLTLVIDKGDGKAIATIKDRFFYPTNERAEFKLGQFIRALALPVGEQFTLDDLAKIVISKRMLADIWIEKSKNPDYADQAGVNPFADNIYYPIGRAAELLGTATSASAGADNPPSPTYLDKLDEEIDQY